MNYVIWGLEEMLYFFLFFLINIWFLKKIENFLVPSLILRLLINEELSDPWHNVRLGRHTSPHQQNVSGYFIHISWTDFAIANSVHSNDGPVAGSDVSFHHRLRFKPSIPYPIISFLEVEWDSCDPPNTSDKMQQKNQAQHIIE